MPDMSSPDKTEDNSNQHKNVHARGSAVENGDLKGFHNPAFKTIYQAFLHGLDVSGNGPCLGTRNADGGPYQWISYKDVETSAQQFGSGLLKSWHPPGQNTLIGIYSKNRAEWVITDLACHTYSMIIVPLYASLGADSCTYMINETNIETIVVEDEEKARGILQMISKTKCVKRLIIIDSFSDNLKALAAANDVQINSFSDILELGKKDLKEPQPPSPSDTFTISYTSGTTGNPKGVILTHEYFLTMQGAFIRQLGEEMLIGCKDRHISYLPLPHVYERFNQCLMFQAGASLGFFRGDPRFLLDDIKELRPTYLPFVPRVLTRLHDEIWKSAKRSKAKSTILKWAISSNLKKLRSGKLQTSSLFDKVIFKKIRAIIGGNVRILIISSAPIQPEITDFARCVFGCKIVEGYGLTEHILACMTGPNETTAGHVGTPVDTSLVKLVDVPEMDYFAAHGQGEVFVKCQIPFPGYFKNPKATAELLDEDGWVRTGDIGQWVDNGCLKIIDRKKNLFKLAQGEYISPEHLESVYSKSEFVQQAFVDGNSFKRWPVAIIVPDTEALKQLADRNNINGKLEELYKSEALKVLVLADLYRIAKEFHLAGYKTVKNILLHPTPFSTQNGELTATFKLKRQALRKIFAGDIEKLYEDIDHAEGGEK